jgi:hypothetical protein
LGFWDAQKRKQSILTCALRCGAPVFNMKRLVIFRVSVFFVLLISCVSAIRINEVELNPNDDCNDCTEWIELYSEQEIILDGWKIMDISNKTLNLSGSINGYYILENFTMSLNNNNEGLFLYNQTSLVQQTPILSDSYNNNQTWQYCDGIWAFADSTRGFENTCSAQNPSQNTSGNQSQNSSKNNTQNTQNNSGADNKIYLKLDWEDNDIVNGEEFDIEVKAYNLKEADYDIKIYINREEDNKMISETYNEDEDKWKSGNYYVESIISGSGDKSATLSLRIKSSYKDFSGDAKIMAKIRKSGTSSIIYDTSEDIEVLKGKVENNKSETQKTSDPDKEDEKTVSKAEDSIKLGNNQNKTNSNIIKLGSGKVIAQESEKASEKGKILYESKSEKIKKYAVYMMNIFLIGILVFLLIRFKRDKKLKEEWQK